MAFLTNTYRIYRDTVVSRACSVIVPPFFLVVILLGLFGHRIDWWLHRSDTYKDKQIKIRTYGIITSCMVSFIWLSLTVYFAVFRIVELSIMFGMVFIVHLSIKISIFRTRLHYTNRYVHFKTGRRTMRISMKEISQMKWECSRNDSAGSLVLYFRGMSLRLPVTMFVGLNHLKETYESKKK